MPPLSSSAHDRVLPPLSHLIKYLPIAAHQLPLAFKVIKHLHRPILKHPKQLLILHIQAPPDSDSISEVADSERNSRVSPVKTHFGMGDAPSLPFFDFRIRDAAEQDLAQEMSGMC